MVNLEDMDLRPGIAISEGVEPCAEQDVLADSVRHGAGEIVFGIPAAANQVRPHRDGESPVSAAGSAAQLFGVSLPQDWNSDRVFEDERGIVELMRGTAEGNP
jgi:hypothetical protein